MRKGSGFTEEQPQQSSGPPGTGYALVLNHCKQT